jgi:hypothetical protein
VTVNAGEVTLRIKIEQEWWVPGAIQGCAEIESRRCFTDAALLIENRNTHGFVVLYKAVFFT